MSWLYPALMRTTALETLRVTWLMALPFAMIVANLRALAEHTLLDADTDVFRAARTTLTSPLLEFFFNHQNYHLEHHLFPALPWHQLPAAHAAMRPVYAEHAPAVSRGYTQFLHDAVVYGPLQGMRYTAGRSHPGGSW